MNRTEHLLTILAEECAEVAKETSKALHFGMDAMSGLTIAKRVAQLVAAHGSLREVSRVVGIDVGYLSRLANGVKTNPSKDTLGRLGLRVVTYYERTKP